MKRRIKKRRKSKIRIRIVKHYTKIEGESKILYALQARRLNGAWYQIVDGHKNKEPMIYPTREEAETKKLEIVKQVRGR
jgi:hypothetical protein